MINTSPVTLITEHIIELSPVLVLAFNDSASTTSHLIQFWAMYIHYYFIRHCHLLLNQNQVYVPILLMKRREEVFLRICVIQYQNIYNNILNINRSDGLYKALFWKFLVQ